MRKKHPLWGKTPQKLGNGVVSKTCLSYCSLFTGADKTWLKSRSSSMPSVWSLWNCLVGKNLVVTWSEAGTLQLNKFSSNYLRPTMMMMITNLRKILQKSKKNTFQSEIFSQSGNIFSNLFAFQMYGQRWWIGLNASFNTWSKAKSGLDWMRLNLWTFICFKGKPPKRKNVFFRTWS